MHVHGFGICRPELLHATRRTSGPRGDKVESTKTPRSVSACSKGELSGPFSYAEPAPSVDLCLAANVRKRRPTSPDTRRFSPPLPVLEIKPPALAHPFDRRNCRHARQDRSQNRKSQGQPLHPVRPRPRPRHPAHEFALDRAARRLVVIARGKFLREIVFGHKAQLGKRG